MNILKDVIAELVSMFIGDARLSAAVLIVVAISAALINLTTLNELVAGAVLLFGCLAVVVESVRSAAARRSAG